MCGYLRCLCAGGLAVLDRYIVADSGAGVIDAGADDAVIAELLQHVGCPTGDTAAAEEGRHHVGLEAESVQEGRAVELDVGIDLARLGHEQAL